MTNTMGGDRPRNDVDAYYTPRKLAVRIVEKLSTVIITPRMVIEPSCGAGAFIEGIRWVWPTVPIWAGDIDGVPGVGLGIMWTRTAWEDARPIVIREEAGYGGTLIVGNPPFLLAQEHIRLGMERLGHFQATEPRESYLCFLLRSSFLAGAKRTELLHRGMGGLRYVWHVAPRPSFTEDGKTDGAEYAVLVWQVGYRGPYQGDWLTWDK